MADLHPPLHPDELRELLVDAELEIDPAHFEQVLAATQPVRATLRTAGGKQRGAMLRGVAMTAGWRPAATAAGFRPLPNVRDTPARVRERPTIDHLVMRLAAVYVGTLATIFALVLGGGVSWITLPFALPAAGLLYCAVTGRGVARFGRQAAAYPGLRALAGALMLFLTGGWFNLYLGVRSLFDRRLGGDGDMIGYSLQAVGAVTLYVLLSHGVAVVRGD